MSDYIKREKVVYQLEKQATIDRQPRAIRRAARIVADFPAADVVERKRGEWLTTDAFPHRVYCSCCYKTYIPNDRWQIWVDGDLPRNYCPNCGADMRESPKEGDV